MCQKSQLARLGLFDAKVPRYTSYPTAPHFGAEVDSGHFISWLGQIPRGSSISLYLHVPFCRNLCWFCMCRTQGARSDAPINDYVSALLNEIDLLKSHLPHGVTVSRLQLGGGTPSILSPDMIRTLMAALQELAPLAPTGEISIEIDPNEFDQARCDALVETGLHGASVGVQDFNPEVQKTIGRLLDFDRTHQVVAMLRAGGVRNIRTDLLYGLPHQSEDAIRHSTEKLLSLSPDRMALYGYIHLPALIRRQAMIPTEDLPTPETRLNLFEVASAQILAAGYQAIGIDHFAQPTDGLAKALKSGQLRRGFQGYVDDPAEVLIGLGASAVSRFPQGYVQNNPSTNHYIAQVSRGQFASARGHAFEGEDQLRGWMIETLLCRFQLPRVEAVRRFPNLIDRFDQLITSADQAFPEVLQITPLDLTMPQESRPLARIIARHFDAYDGAAASHSSAA